MNGYRMLALDIDGTLLNSAGELTPRVRKAITSAARTGIMVTLATGRNVRAVLPIAEALEITAPLVTSNGSVVIRPASRQVYFHKPLEACVAGRAVLLMQRLGLTPYVSRMNLDGPEFFFQEAPAVPEIDLRRGRAAESMQQVPDLAAAAAQMRPLKVMTLDRSDVVERASRYLSKQLGAECRLLVTREGEGFSLLEISAPGVNKATGLAQLAAIFQISPAEIIAIGDNHNDIEMLRFAGLGVAMGNATAELKAVARAVTASNDSDGVAAFLETHIRRAAS